MSDYTLIDYINGLSKRDLTLGEWLQEWQSYKKQRVKPSTYRNIEMIIRLHIPSELKAQPLEALTVAQIEAVLSRVKAERMRQYVRQVLGEALDRAVKLELLDKSPMRWVDNVKHRQKLGKALTRRERAEFMRKLEGSPLKALFEFYLWTGCRRSEALNVRWEDVDIEGGVLYIHGTKSEGSERALPISEPLMQVLDELGPREEGKLFDINPDTVTHAFKVLCPNHKLHDLRHTFATYCLECGVAMRVVQQWLGHSSITVTSRIYSHVLDDFQREEALKLSKGIT